MGQGSRSTATANPILTNFAVGLMPDLQRALANRIAPKVQVGSTIGHYKRYDAKNAFASYDTARAIGGATRRIEFNADDPTYNCQPQGLSIAIDDAERDAAGDADPLLLEQAKTRTLVSNAVIGHEVKVFAAVVAGLAATANLGVFSDPVVDPVAEIDSQIRTIAIATGLMPNNIIFDLIAWEAFRSNPKVKARQPGAELIGLTTIQAANLFINPAIQISVGTLPKDQNKAGLAASNATIFANEVFIFYSSPSPDTYDASFMKTFVGGRGGIEAVETFRDEDCQSDVVRVRWSEDIQVTSLVAAKRITVS